MSLNKELSLEFQLIDTFSDCFFFYTVNHKNTKVRTAYWSKLENSIKGSFNSHDIMLIISDASVKNNIATSVLHIRREHKIIMKTIYHTMNITSTEAELFAMRCDISQVS